ncbi:MAG TPA: hypothetical protein VKI44_14500, partial [Acetobacteraceae bacterium]|nr:hypothetical protein [Acetobacteraceae bacterium]
MEISTERFELALERLRDSDWDRFERLCSGFLVSEWPDVRTVAAASGDEGRDSEVFAPTADSTIAIQYSVQKTWDQKIRRTIQRVKQSRPATTILVFMSNQQIGARGDVLKKAASSQGIYLDVRDRSWFLERLHSDSNRERNAVELARVIVDPLLEKRGVLSLSLAIS